MTAGSYKRKNEKRAYQRNEGKLQCPCGAQDKGKGFIALIPVFFLIVHSYHSGVIEQKNVKKKNSFFYYYTDL